VKERLKKRFDLSSPYLLFTGRLSPRKNIDRLFKAFVSLAAEDPSLRLVLAGPFTGQRPRIEFHPAATDISGRIIYTGPVSDSDLAALYNGCRLFVFPSLYEGFGLPPLEAMACGAPVVCSNASSLPEVTGDAARLVDPLDVRGMTEAMREVTADARLRAEMREKGLRQSKKFSWERNAVETMEVYRKVVYHEARNL
jgi:glycosyltransferase involved in cell wall biosynthesis